jgi:hypothetical protein
MVTLPLLLQNTAHYSSYVKCGHVNMHVPAVFCYLVLILLITEEVLIIIIISLCKLFLMLQRFHVESKGRRKKLNEVLHDQ